MTTATSSKEFAIIEDDMVINEVQKSNSMFIVSRANDVKQKYLKPDDDLRRAITADELVERICRDIDKKFTNRIQ